MSIARRDLTRWSDLANVWLGGSSFQESGARRGA